MQEGLLHNFISTSSYTTSSYTTSSYTTYVIDRSKEKNEYEALPLGHCHGNVDHHHIRLLGNGNGVRDVLLADRGGARRLVALPHPAALVPTRSTHQNKVGFRGLARRGRTELGGMHPPRQRRCRCTAVAIVAIRQRTSAHTTQARAPEPVTERRTEALGCVVSKGKSVSTYGVVTKGRA